MTSRAVHKLLPLCLPLLATGCLAFVGRSCAPDNPGVAGPAVDLGRGTLAVLPFATPGAPYFKSKIGARFSRDVADAVRPALPNATVVDVDGILERIDPPKGPAFSIVRLGESLGADYILYGEIHELSGRPPRSYGVLQGRMTVTARVVDVRNRREVWLSEREKYRFPPPLAGKEETFADETDEEVVIKKTMQEAAKGVAAVFTGRTRPLGERIDRMID
jgi:TolB-like protein